MFQLDFNGKAPKFDCSASIPFISKIRKSDIDYVLLTRWEEHCLECSAPDCFSSCSMYTPRADFMCKRYDYGIANNKCYNGLFNYGADITFKRWGKLQAKLEYKPIRCALFSIVSKLDFLLIKLVQPLTSFTNTLYKYKKANPSLLYNYIRYKLLRIAFRCDKSVMWDFDEFVIEAINPGKEEYTLNIEITVLGDVAYRAAVPIHSGRNLHRLSFSEMNLDLNNIQRPGSLITIYPSNNYPAHIIITWLNFVKYNKKKLVLEAKDSLKHDKQKKIKCVVWDLDNTLWDGILIEDGENNIRLRTNSVTLIKELDKRGIIQTISSKNNHDEAWAIIKKFSLDEYFVYPAINWNPKSQNIKDIAENLNIHIDTFAFIDDSAFERAEVVNTLPEIRTYPDTEIDTLLDRCEFSSLVTNESRRRRTFYQEEVTRKKVADKSGHNHDDFLKTCGMKMDIFTPVKEEQIDRCFELIQRTNQLNISGYRYSKTEFESVISNIDIISLGISCADRFGEYGIVGYVSIQLGGNNPPLICDFVLSCRVARKKVEHALFNWLSDYLSREGYTNVCLKFVPTSRNDLIRATLAEVGFEIAPKGDSTIIMNLPCSSKIPGSDIISVDDTGIQLGD